MAKVSMERIIAQGVLSCASDDERAQAEQCIAALKGVISTVPKEIALMAFMVFSCDLTDQMTK